MDALRAKRCDVSNCCLLCETGLESVPHLFANCAFVSQCWMLLGVNSNTQIWNSLLEFLNWLDSSRNANRKEMFIMVLWSVWHARNNLLWNDVKESPKQVVNRASSVLHQWQMVQKASMQVVLENEFGGGLLSWEKPKEGWSKVNVDAACFRTAPWTGFAAVERDARGFWVSAISDTKMEHLAPVIAEAWALKEALSWIKNRNMSNVVVEVDCLQIVQLLSSDIQPTSYLLCLLVDCVDVLKTLMNVKVYFVYRSANSVAHSLARSTSSMSGRRVWSDDPPEFLLNVLLSDLNQ
ncbi:uncharacterized protein LOC126673217 [Mercurialis annua]|uniref:uncharacterized protein LOC126673217 n=1 Tax=Mercurialis annua TaxID=3986 RepID=UPI0021609E7F|nr:uncharacterized protein LOC126673217 [Mercurialis annua]